MNQIINHLITQKKGPCLSIVIPLHTVSRERMQNPEILRKAIRKGKLLLKRTLQSAQSEYHELATRLDSIALSFDPIHTQEGMGLFVSATTLEMVHFPFPVHEKIKVGNSFETRDLHYLNQFIAPYLVVLLTKWNTRLFSAQHTNLIEIQDGHFPLAYEDEYEYSRTSLGTSFGYALKQYEKDKRTLTKLRLQTFMKEADSYLNAYLKKNNGVVLAGTKPNIALFKSGTAHTNKIIGQVTGTFDNYNFEELRLQSWLSFTRFRKQEFKNTINDFKEKNTNRIAKGLQEVWEAAQHGKGKLLVVEKDYTAPTYLRDGDPMLYVRPPKGKHTLLPDAVSEIIEIVTEKGGKVMFTEPNKLRSFNGIALLKRY